MDASLDPIIRAVQGKVNVDSDGVAGPETWRRIYQTIFGKNWGDPEEVALPPPTLDGSTVDARSETAIATLLPQVKPYARALLNAAAKRGITLIVTSALRTYEQQNDLYAQGRTKPGKIVTNAPAGYSNHNFGLAFDVTIFEKGEPVWESPIYQTVGAIGKNLGLMWGGDWASIDDEPHFELYPPWAHGESESSLLAQLRQRHDAGDPIFA